MSLDQIKKTVARVIDEESGGENVKSISLFGSYLKGNQSPESDIDLLFDTKKTMTLFQISGLQYRLEQGLGKKVDLVPKNSLDRYIKDDILSEAKVIYGQ